MKRFLKFTKFFLILGVLCFLCSGLVRAADNPPTAQPNVPKIQGVRCPACADIVAKIEAQKTAIKDLDDKIKALQVSQKAKNDAEKAQKEAARQAKMEQLKQKDPKKYEEMMAKQDEKPKAGTAPKPQLSKEERLARMKEKNPEMYALVVQRDQLKDELKTLHEQKKNCQASCQKGK